MNEKMYHQPVTQHNLQQLANRQLHIWGPAQGEQACGDSGFGRLLEPADILQRVARFFAPGVLQGRKLLITAGPTREAIDPVRYISNHSSGKMGYALARAAQQAGAEVTLISGPVCLPQPPALQQFVAVTSAQQMFDAVHERIAEQDIFIANAAVADYRIEQQAAHKIKKSTQSMTLQLTPNPDILQSVAALAQRPFCVGFAAETENLQTNALDKLQRKKLDMIAVNQVGGEQSAFDSDSNAVTVYSAAGQQELARAAKADIAKQLIEMVASAYNARQS